MCCGKDIEIRNSRRVCSHPESRGVEVNLVKMVIEIITEGKLRGRREAAGFSLVYG